MMISFFPCETDLFRHSPALPLRADTVLEQFSHAHHASLVTGVELDHVEAQLLRHKVSTRGLADSRRSAEECCAGSGVLLVPLNDGGFSLIRIQKYPLRM